MSVGMIELDVVEAWPFEEELAGEARASDVLVAPDVVEPAPDSPGVVTVEVR